MILINYYFYLFSVHFSICPFVRLSFVFPCRRAEDQKKIRKSLVVSNIFRIFVANKPIFKNYSA